MHSLHRALKITPSNKIDAVSACPAWKQTRSSWMTGGLQRAEMEWEAQIQAEEDFRGSEGKTAPLPPEALVRDHVPCQEKYKLGLFYLF